MEQTPKRDSAVGAEVTQQPFFVNSPVSEPSTSSEHEDLGMDETPHESRPRLLDGEPLSSPLRWYAPPRRKYTRRELLADRLINFGGAGLSWLGAPLLVYISHSMGDDIWKQVGFLAFGMGLVAMLNCSAFYHLLCWQWDRADQLFALDHIGISSMIMGGYVPVMQAMAAWKTLVVVLCLGLIGWLIEAYKLLAGGHLQNAKSGFNWLDIFQVVRYLVMGWACLAVAPWMTSLPGPALGLYIGGGIMYTIGVPIFMRHHMEYHMPIWHGFVLVASCCFYSGNLWLVGLPE